MAARITGFFLGAYQERDYILKQKVRIVSIISLIIVFAEPLIIGMNLYTGQTGVEVNAPLVLVMAIVMTSLWLLRKGMFSAAAHLVLIITLAAVWATLFFDSNTIPIVVLDSIVYVPGLLVLTPIVITRRKSAILLYTAANIILFGGFLAYVSARFALDDVTFIDYTVDSAIAILFVGIMCYLIFRINKTALDRSEEESRKNEDQFTIIRGLYESIRDASKKLSIHSEELSKESGALASESQSQAAVIEEITATTEEVSGGVDMVSERVARQFDSMRSLLGSIETLSASVGQVADRIGRTRAMADEISGVAARGGDILNAMSRSFSTVKESSDRMTGIVGMIGDISDKTNLLSLNAAIEAARAGEAGRGFAVVADEISKLADQTAASIKEIENLIRANVEEMSRGMANVDATVNTIMQIIQGVGTITMEIDQVSRQIDGQKEINLKVTGEAGAVVTMSEEIKGSVQEQRGAMSEIVKSVNSLNEITQVYTDGARKMSDQSRDMDVMVKELHGITSIMDD
ncbi:MAG: hypothetical protein JXA20_11795 [Spirochaetes bacterium]|nr:hypothetical protein [Spirochaetota bacterium]